MDRRAAIAVALLIPLLAACGGSASVPPATATPHGARRARVADAATATETATAAACPAAGVIPRGPLPSCAYAINVGAHTATFSIAGSGWLGGRYPGLLELTRQAPFGIFTLTTFAGRVYTDPCTGVKTTTIDASPKSFIDFIAASKEFVAAEPVAATFAGDTLQLDVTADGVPACADWVALWGVWGGGIFGHTLGEYGPINAATIGNETVVWVRNCRRHRTRWHSSRRSSQHLFAQDRTGLKARRSGQRPRSGLASGS